jgi:hypothetical protein
MAANYKNDNERTDSNRAYIGDTPTDPSRLMHIKNIQQVIMKAQKEGRIQTARQDG